MPSDEIRPAAMAVGFSWFDVETQVQHVLHLLETEGDTALRVVAGTLKLIKLAAARDMVGVFIELNKASVDVRQLIEAIKLEFGVN